MSNTKGFDEFDNLLKALDEELSDEARVWLDSFGFMFLDEVQREIIRTGTVDTRRLLNSFDKGSSDGVWEKSDMGLTLEIGTNVEYAAATNSGHATVDLDSGKDRRWVPGYWQGDRFIYDKDAKTGMLLKVKWVDGTYYFDTAVKIFEAMFNRSISQKIRRFMDRKLGGGGRK